MSAALLVAVMLDPVRAQGLDARGWTALLTAARAERLIGTLAAKLDGLPVPGDVAAILADVRLDLLRERRQALWEIDRAMTALAPLDCPVVLLKGSAFLAAGLLAGQGRAIGDLDILVPRERIGEVETALLAAGWDWVKPDPYDDAYYRRWMHELPPLIHHERDRMIDVHHTILPLTAKPRPDPASMIAQAQVLADGTRVLCPEHIVIHAAAHLFADGDLSGGLRNLWDIDQLCREFRDRDDHFLLSLHEEAHGHGLGKAVNLALRLSHAIFETPLRAYASPIRVAYRSRPSDALFRARLLTRTGWGQEGRPLLRLAFYVRSHLLRMPPLMLARHLWTKWCKGYRPVG
jgi:hypothetical protein